MILLKKSILKSAINGKNKSIKKIIKNYINFSYSISVFFLENDKLAKENIKNVMIKIYEDISKLDSYRDFYFWFYTLIKDGIKEYKRKNAYTKSYSKDDFIDLYFRINNIKYDQNAYNIFKQILNFEDEEKEIFILIEFEGLSCRQASKLLNIPLEIVRYKLYNSKNILKKCYERTQ